MKRGRFVFIAGIFFLFLFVNFGSIYAFCGGAGRLNDPYLICDWHDLNEVREYSISSARYFLLNNSLDKNSEGYYNYNSHPEGWVPINNFGGNFDGGGNYISDLYINRTSGSVGLFGDIYYKGPSTIQNLELKDVDVSGLDYTGSLAGRFTSSFPHLFNCTSSGKVVGSNYVGGLVGWMSSLSEVDGCSFFGEVEGSYIYTGGLFGNFESSRLSRSYFIGNVSSSSSQSIAYVGGLVGRFGNGFFENNSAIGRVSSSASLSYVGGLVGSFDNGISKNSFFSGELEGSKYVGGIFGKGSSLGTSLFWDKTVSGVDVACGTGSCNNSAGKTTSQMRKISTYSGWDICSTEDDLNNGYPYLAWQVGRSDCIWLIPSSFQGGSGRECISQGGYCSPISIGNASVIEDGDCLDELSCYSCNEGYFFDSSFNCVPSDATCVSGFGFGYWSYWNDSSGNVEWTYNSEEDFSGKVSSCKKGSLTCCPDEFVCSGGKCVFNKEKNSLGFCSSFDSESGCNEASPEYAKKELGYFFKAEGVEGNQCDSEWKLNSSSGKMERVICSCSWEENSCKATLNVEMKSEEISGGGSSGTSPGTSIREKTIITTVSPGTCELGFMNVLFTSSNDPEGVEPRSQIVPCGSELKLPFFGAFSFVLCLILFAGYYFVLSFSKNRLKNL